MKMKECRKTLKTVSTLLGLIVVFALANAIYLGNWYMTRREISIPWENFETSPPTLVRTKKTSTPQPSAPKHLDTNQTIEKNNIESRQDLNIVPRAAPLKKSYRGYVLAGDYWEQQSSACRNLQNLQCWAAKLDLYVVEPFMANSQLKTPFANMVGSKLLFSDLFDLQSWNRASVKLGRKGLVEWENFVENAPREVIYVHFKFSNWNDIRKVKKEVLLNPSKYPPKGERHKVGCDMSFPFKPYETKFVADHNFTVVRSVCFNFEYGDFVSLKDFQMQLYGAYSPQEVTVYFRQWRGLGMHPRVAVEHIGCTNDGLQEVMEPSQQMKAAAEWYIEEHLGEGDFIAIMARIEKSKISLKSRSDSVSFCFSKTVKQWQRLRNKTNIQSTFLASDAGKYGSNSFKTTGDDSDLTTEFHKFFKQIYGTKTTVGKWEKTFEGKDGITDSGYIALLQKLVATRSKCVLFVGGGAFQKHALHMYRQLHSGKQECIEVVKECTEAKSLPL